MSILYDSNDIDKLRTNIKNDSYENQFRFILDYFDESVLSKNNFIAVINIYAKLFSNNQQNIMNMLKYAIKKYPIYKRNIYFFVLNNLLEYGFETNYFINIPDIIIDTINTTHNKDLICRYIIFLLRNNNYTIELLSKLIDAYDRRE